MTNYKAVTPTRVYDVYTHPIKYAHPETGELVLAFRAKVMGLRVEATGETETLAYARCVTRLASAASVSD